jgi:hypothetical protein
MPLIVGFHQQFRTDLEAVVSECMANGVEDGALHIPASADTDRKYVFPARARKTIADQSLQIFADGYVRQGSLDRADEEWALAAWSGCGNFRVQLVGIVRTQTTGAQVQRPARRVQKPIVRIQLIDSDRVTRVAACKFDD